MNNLHIILNNFKHESRAIKETTSLSQSGIFETIFIASLHDDGQLEDEVISANVLLKRVNLSSKKYSKVFFIQIFKYFEFLYRVYKMYKNKNIQVVNIHHLALLPLGYFFKLKFKTKLIYDPHELETETNGLSESKFRQFSARILEKLFIKKCDLVFVVSESIADFYQNKYKIERPLVVLNAPRMLDYKQKNNKFREIFGIRENSSIFLYQGALEKGRGIEFILDTFCKFKNNQNVVVFMGYGSLKSNILSSASKSNNVFYHDAVPANIVLDYTSSADYGLSLIENTCLSYYYSMPNKLFEYLMVGLPVLVSNLKEMREFIMNHGCGEIVDEMKSESLENAINRITSKEKTIYSVKAIETSKSFSWENQEKKYVSAINKIIKE